MSTIQVINAKHPSSASNNIVLDNAGNATFAGNAAFAGTAAMASSFLRNRIINGDMRIDQRNAGASVTPASSIYTLDRWYAIISQASKFSVQRSTVVPATFTNSLLATSLAATTVGSSDFFAMAQFVEGFNGADLGWGTANAQTVTLSFRVRSSLTGTFVVAIRSGGDDAAYPATYTINAANTWETKSITIPGPTTGTFATDSGRCFGVWFVLGMGSAFQTTANTWGGGSALGVSGAVNVVSTNGATFYLTGVQLEVGTAATPFERRQYGQELELCQRYFQNHPQPRGRGVAAGANALNRLGFTLPTTMRAAPTGTISGALEWYDGSGTGTLTAFVVTYATTGSFEFDANAATGTTAQSRPIAIFVGGTASINLSAEL